MDFTNGNFMKKSTSSALKSLSETLASIGIETARERRAGEFTIREAAKAAGVSEVHMGAILRRRVLEETLFVRVVVLNGRATKLYRKA